MIETFLSGVLLLLLLAPVCVWNVQAEEKQLYPAQQLFSAGAAPLQPGTYAIPCVADWNGDGKKDLLVGYQLLSKIALYLNTGTDAEPVFPSSLGVNLQALNSLKTEFVDIQHYAASGNTCGAPAPYVCDYDNDGKMDLLVGGGPDGYVYFYRNINSDASPILDTGVRLKAGRSLVSVVYRATPCVADWDGDGLNDLLCGCGDGWIYFFKNTGTPQVPDYAAGIKIQVAGSDLNLGIRSVVRIFDWDGDGLNDLVCSSSTGVYWCRNVGTLSSPFLQVQQAVHAPVPAGGLVPLCSSTRMRLELTDWNNDGVIDLLVGDTAGTVSCYQGYRFAMRILGQDMCGGYIVQWNSAPFLRYNMLAGYTPGGITNCVGSNIPSSGLTTCWTNACGDLQQFYRLQIAE